MAKSGIRFESCVFHAPCLCFSSSLIANSWIHNSPYHLAWKVGNIIDSESVAAEAVPTSGFNTDEHQSPHGDEAADADFQHNLEIDVKRHWDNVQIRGVQLKVMHQCRPAFLCAFAMFLSMILSI